MLPRKNGRCRSRNPSHAEDPSPNRNTHNSAPTDYHRPVAASPTPGGPTPANLNPDQSHAHVPARAGSYPCAHTETNSVPHTITHAYPGALGDADAGAHAPLHPQLSRSENPPPLTNLHDISSVVEEVRASVVSVVALVEVRQGLTTDTQPQSGSGVLIDGDGHILTNHHVIEGAVSVSVTLDDGRKLDAELVGSDPLTDLALLRVDDTSLPFIPFADPSAVRVGEWVIAIGNALALPGGPSVTLGIVSALDRSFAPDQDNVLYGLIQTDAMINPGNSGGPLMNLAGEIVGINTAALRGGRVEGIGFAVGGETAIHVSNQLIEWGRVQWPWLGVVISELDAETAAEMKIPFSGGIIIRSVVSDGPAETGGLRADDIILSMDDAPTAGIRDFVQLLRLKFAVNQNVDVEVWRDGQMGRYQVSLGERPTSPL